MELSIEMRGLLLGIFLTVILVIIYLQMRTIKDRGKRIEAKVQRDDLYNSIMTVRAVSNSLRNQGRDVSGAESIVHRAEMAYQARNDARCRKLVCEARATLEKAKDAPVEVIVPMTVAVKEKAGAEEFMTLNQESMKLPQNYLQAKFVMGMVEKELEGCERSKVDKVSGLLEEARDAFAAEDYDSSLRHSNCALKVLREDGPIAKVTNAVCLSCGKEVKDGEKYCRQCGRSMTERNCPACGERADGDDLFCGKCGQRIE
jgi:hypothetical protein